MQTAILLAAGEGRRAWPYCGIRQKVTVPIANEPMVRRLARQLRDLGVERFVVVTGHRSGAVRACLADIDNVRFVRQSRLDGAVDAALTGLENLDEGDHAVICCADVVTTSGTLRAFLDACKSRSRDPLLLTADCPAGLTSSYTTVVAGNDGLVQDISGRGGHEHPRFGGIAGARADLLERYLLRNPGIMENVGVGAMPPPEGDLAYTFKLMRENGLDVHAVHARDFLVDVDKPWHIIEANRRAARHMTGNLDKTVVGAGAHVDDAAHVAPDAKLVLRPGAYIGPGCRIDGSVILGENARVAGGAILHDGVVAGANTRCQDYCLVGDGSVLGDRTIIGHCAEFEGVTFEKVYLYHYCCVTGLVGTHVDIGAATVSGAWRFDDKVKNHKIDGRDEIPECFGNATFIGDYCRTGVNAMFMPGVKIGYYSCIGPGVIVYDDVPERTMLLARQEQAQKPWGPEKLGW